MDILRGIFSRIEVNKLVSGVLLLVVDEIKNAAEKHANGKR